MFMIVSIYMQVVFEGVRGNGPQGNIAIDDITWGDGYCKKIKHFNRIFMDFLIFSSILLISLYDSSANPSSCHLLLVC